MYKLYPSLVLGFHACDQSVGEKVLSGETSLKPSKNDYDWLGHGVYFWENSPRRAEEWGEMRKRRKRIDQPCVVGAVIALGRCFDLLESSSLSVLRKHYDALVISFRQASPETPLPKNESRPGSEDLLLRKLDRAVIEYMHNQMEKKFEKDGKIPSFDSVRCAFWEGEELYPGAGFKEKSHIQICVRNLNCIKGYFRQVAPVENYPAV